MPIWISGVVVEGSARRARSLPAVLAMSSIIMRFREGVLVVAVGAGAGLAGSFLVARHMWQRTGAACDGIDACPNAMRAARGLRHGPPPPPQRGGVSS